MAATPAESTGEENAPGTTAIGPDRRARLVRKAVAEWKRQLIDLGGRNNLLKYRDLKRGTLDLASAEPRAVTALLQDKPVRISALFPDDKIHQDALRRVRTINKKTKENFEERGIETLSLACGMGTWEDPNHIWEPRAPILLRQATLRPLGAAQDEFELSLRDEMEVNATLLHFLKVNFDCDFDEERLLDRVDGIIDEPWELQSYEWIAEQTTQVPNFKVDPRLVLANFAYAKLPMVKDLESSLDELIAHDLIAAIAGDEEARGKTRGKGTDAYAIPHPDDVPLADEFLILDADSSQDYAINAVIAGASLIVRGPPGTGKSQTIANLIGSLVARRKRVLFVAEKRAAIEAVLKRLHQQKLDDLVLDLHGGVSSRRTFARAIRQALEGSRTAPKVDNGADLLRVERRRGELNCHVQALHEKREPWDVSAYDIRAQLLGLSDARTDIRFRGDELQRLNADAKRQIEDNLAEYVRLGGLTLSSSGSPWATSNIVSKEDVQRAHALIDGARRLTMPRALAALNHVTVQVGLPLASTLSGWQPRLELMLEVVETLLFFQPSIYAWDLPRICNLLAPAAHGELSRMTASFFSRDYRTTRRHVRRLRVSETKTSDGELLHRCQAANDQRFRWRSFDNESSPTAAPDVEDCFLLYRGLTGQMHEVEELVGAVGLTEMPVEDVEQLLDKLLEDRATLVKLPELHRLKAWLVAAGLGALLSEMEARHGSEDLCIRSFRWAWLHSLLDHLSITDDLVGSFIPEKHDKAIDDFIEGDRAHIETTAGRIRRICAEQAVRARDEFRDQDEVVRHQTGLKRRHLPVRDLVRRTPDVLLTLKPCWVMSPLVVSQLLPPKIRFDVVIFDEASQITPADAVPSILRGDQLVVAGDEKQLPPTAFFVSEAPEEEEEEVEEPDLTPIVAGTQGFESILDALGTLLGFRMLRWHYRSRDERLIAFSNAHIYDRMLTTFPGMAGEEVLGNVVAPWSPGAETNSPTPEVEVVTDLILQHARTCPKESLGVITMGIKHANRIEECLRQRLSEKPDLESELSDFFDEEHEERFFVKNLERVQGDERDAIILSIGYGKNSRGELPYRFGPLLTEGGERRLNVAVTRAKSRVTLVSSFSSTDLDPDRSTAEGVKLLRQYLQYVESRGVDFGDSVVEKPILNPFEVDVRDTLMQRGLSLTAQYGSSGYWIDFAVHHPTQRGRYVLAIECDGATYHSSESARDRDRLRQEQLERLGWRFCRIWSSEWFHDKDRATEKVLASYNDAVRDADPSNVEPTSTSVAPGAQARNEGPTDGRNRPSTPPLARPRGSRPSVQGGRPIQEYTRRQLVELGRWIESDDVLRTEDELLTEMMRELKLQRRGRRMVAVLMTAIGQIRR